MISSNHIHLRQLHRRTQLGLTQRISHPRPEQIFYFPDVAKPESSSLSSNTEPKLTTAGDNKPTSLKTDMESPNFAPSYPNGEAMPHSFRRFIDSDTKPITASSFTKYQLLSRSNVFTHSITSSLPSAPNLSDVDIVFNPAVYPNFQARSDSSLSTSNFTETPQYREYHHRITLQANRVDHRTTITGPLYDVQDCGNGFVIVSHNAITYLCVRDTNDVNNSVLEASMDAKNNPPAVSDPIFSSLAVHSRDSHL